MNRSLDIPVLQLGDIQLTRVESILYLGVYLDEDLSWRTQVNHVSNKISKANGVLRRLKHCLPPRILKILYFTLINSHLNYALLAWGFKIKRIELLQKQSIRIITNSTFLSHTDRLFKSMGILKVEDIFNLKQLLFYKKFLLGSLPSSISSIIKKQDTNLRSCHSYFFLRPPIMARTENAKLCLRYSLPKFINGFDFDFISSLEEISLHTVKIKFKQKTLLSYNEECSIINCFVCNPNAWLT